MTEHKLIKLDDALECFMGFARMGDVKDAIAALPAVVPSVKPLVWLQQYNAIGEPTNFWQAADPVLNVCWHANPTRPKEVVEATRSDRILAVLELVAAPDPAATREAALVSAVAKQIGEEHGWVRREELEAAEAKLTKAVDALRVSLEGLNWAKAYLSTSGIDSVQVNYADAKVYAVLAELEGK